MLERAALRDVPRIDGLDAVVAIGFYHDPRLRLVLHALKYRGGTVMLPCIVEAVQQWSVGKTLPWEGEAGMLVQPLIGAPRRVRERGFDQARLLADSLVDVIAPSAVMGDVLMRRDTDTAQAVIDNPALRQANISGMFIAKDAPMPRSVLLIDDVVTTGSTMSEAACVLRAAGVERVYGFAIALGK